LSGEVSEATGIRKVAQRACDRGGGTQPQGEWLQPSLSHLSCHLPERDSGSEAADDTQANKQRMLLMVSSERRGSEHELFLSTPTAHPAARGTLQKLRFQVVTSCRSVHWNTWTTPVGMSIRAGCAFLIFRVYEKPLYLHL
jgi:hypothetical protein